MKVLSSNNWQLEVLSSNNWQMEVLASMKKEYAARVVCVVERCLVGGSARVGGKGRWPTECSLKVNDLRYEYGGGCDRCGLKWLAVT